MAIETRKINMAPGYSEDFFSIPALRLRSIKNWRMDRLETQQNAASHFDDWTAGHIFGTLNGYFWQEPWVVQDEPRFNL
jgi:hypothetical protein